MKTRLESLLHQREIIREHLRWLDGEIDAPMNRAGTVEKGLSPPQTRESPVETPSPLPAATSPAAGNPVEIPREVDVVGLHNEVRRGCLLYAAISGLLLGGLIGFIYWRY